MLLRVFAECKRKLEPGGRIAVNVANLGRRPYRSLSSDVIEIMQDRLGLLLRGEVIWAKGEGASGSCAWGSFRQASNPVLRDLTERVIIASKGRFDRARTTRQRKEQGLPCESTVAADEFMAATLDVWNIGSERATRVGHPAPFPVELPQRLIELYTYRGDLVLDPFMGSGSTLVAAARTGRAGVGYDLEESYVEIAYARLTAEQARVETRESANDAGPDSDVNDALLAYRASIPASDDYQARATIEGKAAQGIAEDVLCKCGFDIIARNRLMSGLGLVVNFIARDRQGKEWYFDVSGAFTSPRAGLLRTDTLWKSLGRALVLTAAGKERIVLLTSHLPQRRSAGDQALRAVGPARIFDAMEMLSPTDQRRLTLYARGAMDCPLTGFWTEHDGARAADAQRELRSGGSA